MPNDKRFINFDTLDFTPVAITKRGRTWELRDDIPMRVMARCFLVLNFWPDFQRELAATEAEADEATARAAIDNAFDEIAGLTVPLVGDIFRHSDPNVTDDEIAQWFSDEDRMRIIRVFFTNRSQSSSEPPSQPPQTVTPAPAPAKAKANRAARRERAR